MNNSSKNPADALLAARCAFLGAWFEACKLAPDNPHTETEIEGTTNAMRQLALIAKAETAL